MTMSCCIAVIWSIITWPGTIRKELILFFLAFRAKAEEGHMDAVNLIAGAVLELLVERCQCGVVNFTRFTAGPADEMVVVTFSDLVNELPISHMGG